MFIYEIQAFAYSDFEHHILVHEKKFTEIEFRKMIEIARQKAKPKLDKWGMPMEFATYPDNFIKVLIDEFGFEYSTHLVAHVGCDYDDKCTVELE